MTADTTETTAKPETSTKPETSASETSSSKSSSSDSSSSGGTEKIPVRETSYFSNVRSDRYRSRWGDIFSDKPKKKQAAKTKAKAPQLPLSVELADSDLDAETLAQIETVIRKKENIAKREWDRLKKSNGAQLRIRCEISD